MNKPYLCRNFFLTDWRHKRLKNTINLLFYKKHFYEFSESVLWFMMFMIAYYFILTNQHLMYSAYSVYSVIRQ